MHFINLEFSFKSECAVSLKEYMNLESSLILKHFHHTDFITLIQFLVETNDRYVLERSFAH